MLCFLYGTNCLYKYTECTITRPKVAWTTECCTAKPNILTVLSVELVSRHISDSYRF